MLFILYTNSLLLNIKSYGINVYADNTALVQKAKTGLQPGN